MLSQQIAWPPIKRNRVPAEISATKNEFQSSLRRKVAEPILTEPFDNGEAFFRLGSRDVFAIEPLTFLKTRDADDTLDAHHISMPDARASVHCWGANSTATSKAAPPILC